MKNNIWIIITLLGISSFFTFPKAWSFFDRAYFPASSSQFSNQHNFPIQDVEAIINIIPEITISQRDTLRVVDFEIVRGFSDIDVRGDASTLDTSLIQFQPTVEYPLFLASDQASLTFRPTGKAGIAEIRIKATSYPDSITVEKTLRVIIQQTIPQAVNDAFEVDEDNILTADVTLNDLDEDTESDDLGFILVDSVQHGSLIYKSKGEFEYTPDPDFYGEDRFSYRTFDELDTTDVAQVIIHVNPVNDPPSIANLPDTIRINQNDDLKAYAFEAFAGPDNESDQSLSFRLESSQEGLLGNLTVEDINAGNFLLSLKPLGIPGELTLHVSAKDIDASHPAGLDSTEFSIYVIIIQNIPIAQNNSYILFEDTPFTLPDSLSILNNDPDQDSETLNAVLAQNPQYGNLNLNANGSFSYQPQMDFFGTDTFRYLADDGENLSDTATVFLNVIAVNDAPRIVGLKDTIQVKQNAGLDTLSFQVNAGAANETDQILSLSAQSLTPALLGDPTSGISGEEAQLIYAIVGQPGIGQIVVNLRDNGGTNAGGLDHAVDTFYVEIIQNVPIANSDTFVLDEDTPFTNSINILANDIDADNPTSELLAEKVTEPAQGVLQLEPNGIFSYTPNPNFNGTDSFVYRVLDPEGNTDSSTVFLQIAPVNDAPVAVSDNFNIPEDGSLFNVNVRNNDSDVDNLLTELRVALVQAPNQTNFTLSPQGELAYTSSPNFNGTDSLIYQLNDGVLNSNPVVVKIIIEPQNDAPIAVKDSLVTLEDTNLTYNVLMNDSDVENDSLSVNLLRDVQSGVLLLRSNGIFDYLPNKDFEGTDSFTYTATDGKNTSAITLVILTVIPVNDPPISLPNAYATLEDRPLTAASVLDNDRDPDLGDAIVSARVVTFPNHGTIEFNDTTGTFVYVPAPNYFGVDEFYYVCNDGEVDSEPTQVRIQINPVKDAPTAQADIYGEVYEDQLFQGTSVLDNDTDVDNENLSTILLKNVEHGTLTFDTGTGTFTYLPEQNYVGEDSFSYQASDSILLSDTTEVLIIVNPVNDPPEAIDLKDHLSVDLDDGFQSYEFSLGTGIGEDDQQIAELGVSPTEPGILANLAIVLLPNKKVRLEFTPLQVDTTLIEIFVRDNGGVAHEGIDSKTFPLRIEISQGLLIPNDDKVTITEDQILIENVQSLKVNDLFGINRNPEIFISQDPAHVSIGINPDGTITYQAAPDYFGADQFKYRLKLGERLSEQEAIVDVEILPVNDAPVIAGLPTSLSLSSIAGLQHLEFRLTSGPLEIQNFAELKLTPSNIGILTDLKLERITDSTAFIEFTPLASGSTELTIFARDNGGTSDGGNDLNEQTIPIEIYEVAPPSVGTLTANASKLSEISLTWDDLTINEDAFVIERSLEDESNFEPIAQVNENTTTYVDSDLREGTSTYCYRVRALNEIGESPYSNIACVTRRNNEILLPNTFTPNGDKRNDRFILRSLNVQEVDFRVFDRNGNVVFSTHNVQEATQQGWDGGEQPPGVYVWAVRVKFDDGIVRDAKGKINLIR